MLSSRRFHGFYTRAAWDLIYDVGGGPFFNCDYLIYEGNLMAWDVRSWFIFWVLLLGVYSPLVGLPQAGRSWLTVGWSLVLL